MICNLLCLNSGKKHKRLLLDGMAGWQTCKRIGALGMGSMPTQGLIQALNLNSINRLVLSIPFANPVYSHPYGLAGKVPNFRSHQWRQQTEPLQASGDAMVCFLRDICLLKYLLVVSYPTLRMHLKSVPLQSRQPQASSQRALMLR